MKLTDAILAVYDERPDASFRPTGQHGMDYHLEILKDIEASPEAVSSAMNRLWRAGKLTKINRWVEKDAFNHRSGYRPFFLLNAGPETPGKRYSQSA
jgi:hypothetical protein